MPSVLGCHYHSPHGFLNLLHVIAADYAGDLHGTRVDPKDHVISECLDCNSQSAWLSRLEAL